MDISRFTQKSQEALAQAEALAGRFQNPEIRPEHLTVALLEQEGGLLPRILTQMEKDSGALDREASSLAAKGPRVSGAASRPSLSRPLSQALDKADQEARGMMDDYISVEHLFLGILDVAKGESLGKVLGLLGITREGFLQALRKPPMRPCPNTGWSL